MRRAARGPLSVGPSILDALADSNLFGPWFQRPASWSAWLVCLKALFGLPMAPAEIEVFTQCTGRRTPPTAPIREAWFVVGRRGGKSRIAALVAVYLACFRDYTAVLAPGERGVIMVLAADREQARVIFGYIEALFDQIPMLAALVTHRTKEEIILRRRLVIRVQTASFRSVRGYTIVAAILDEVAFWHSEDSANPDIEIVNAIRPAMATVPQPLLLGISSPYARRGVLYDQFRRHYGADGDPVLIWQAPTTTMNPAVDPQIIATAYADDPAAAAAEYGAQFRTDVESFLSREIVEVCVEQERRVRPPLAGIEYIAFVDPSGGVGDSFALAIAHAEDEARSRVLLDLIHERRAPLSPAQVVREFVELLTPYRCTTVHGDRYSEEFVREHFRSQGVSYRVSERNRSELYAEMLPLLTSGRATLLNQPRLIAQLLALERKTGASGKDVIIHPPSGHDDVANAVAGALVQAAKPRQVLAFEEFVPLSRQMAATAPFDQPRVWTCPTGCGLEITTTERTPRCPRCQPDLTGVLRQAIRGL